MCTGGKGGPKGVLLKLLTIFPAITPSIFCPTVTQTSNALETQARPSAILNMRQVEVHNDGFGERKREARETKET